MAKRAVMFCLMDVSGSMDEARKDLVEALLHPALPVPDAALREDRPGLHPPSHAGGRKSTKQNFFRATRDRRHGGVECAGADGRDHQARATRPTDWNIYGAQASDGDNWHHDSAAAAASCWSTESLLPQCRYFAYVQVAEEEQNLWEEYAAPGQETQVPHFAMRKVIAGRRRSIRSSAICSARKERRRHEHARLHEGRMPPFGGEARSATGAHMTFLENRRRGRLRLRAQANMPDGAARARRRNSRPLTERPSQPLPTPSDWTFEHGRAVPRRRFARDRAAIRARHLPEPAGESSPPSR